jgi:hypothetical protein
MKLFFFVAFTATTLFAASSTLQDARDPFKELQRTAEKEAGEKNYKELKDAAAELGQLSNQIIADIDQGGKDAISAHIFERLDRIEKLVKKIREKAKGSPTPPIGGRGRSGVPGVAPATGCAVLVGCQTDPPLPQ